MRTKFNRRRPLIVTPIYLRENINFNSLFNRNGSSETDDFCKVEIVELDVKIDCPDYCANLRVLISSNESTKINPEKISTELSHSLFSVKIRW